MVQRRLVSLLAAGTSAGAAAAIGSSMPGLPLWSLVGTTFAAVVACVVLCEGGRSIPEWFGALWREWRSMYWQKIRPWDFARPRIAWIDLFPAHGLPGAGGYYIEFALDFDNPTSWGVIVEDIRGTISIGGSYPPEHLPPIELGCVRPHSTFKEPPVVPVRLGPEALRTVRLIRENGRGEVDVKLALNYRINGRSRSHPVSQRAYYVDARLPITPSAVAKSRYH